MLIYFEILWNLLKLLLVIYWKHIAYLHTLTKRQSLPFPWMERMGERGELSTNPRRSEAVGQKQKRVETESPSSQNRASKTEKGRNRESKQSQNRASKTEKGRKPIVKTRSKSKADSRSPKTSQKPQYSRNNHRKTRQIHKNTNRTNRQNSQQRILEKHVHIMHSSRHNCALPMM